MTNYKFVVAYELIRGEIDRLALPSRLPINIDCLYDGRLDHKGSEEFLHCLGGVEGEDYKAIKTFYPQLGIMPILSYFRVFGDGEMLKQFVEGARQLRNIPARDLKFIDQIDQRLNVLRGHQESYDG